MLSWRILRNDHWTGDRHAKWIEIPQRAYSKRGRFRDTVASIGLAGSLGGDKTCFLIWLLKRSMGFFARSQISSKTRKIPVLDIVAAEHCLSIIR
jgi:hypothetical protein